ncbi:Uu.00g083610.m01.CDS01 [Anthostomella pinea]|uniref:Cutinase n=1 Tax=Anthostomella pinea TaxID=933095 RepID=A0AAI8VLK9_9PEZI|nr:Uu.00g083610.m01.CDS01 [Anthostomella pinea]
MRRAALVSAAVFSALASAQSTGLDTCTDVHIFLARGNNEPYPGRQSKIVDAVCGGLSSCDYEDIQFTNALEDNYCTDVDAGRAAGVKQITAYNKRCPDAKLVISGYSQGSHVVGDILGGGGGTFYNGCTTTTSSGLDVNSAPGNKIAAAIIFGNPRHTAEQSYDEVEGSPFSGLLPRTGDQLAALNNFAAVLQDYCQFDDPICAVGDGTRTTNVADHLNYFDKYTDTAGAWVQSMVNGTTTTTTSSSTSESSTTSTSSTSLATRSASSTSASQDPSATATLSTGSAGNLLLPEATATFSNTMPTATSGAARSRGGDATGVVRGFTGLVTLVTLGFLGFHGGIGMLSRSHNERNM